MKGSQTPFRFFRVLTYHCVMLVTLAGPKGVRPLQRINAARTLLIAEDDRCFPVLHMTDFIRANLTAF
ncbi:hypothetical protein AD947_03195 [Acetobacter tropicalis]|uniref:Uncharacterized protein n=1 Tax=Acetobacter tropicalis TaxID=104102 RepID=A0A149U345_9PROT|nr:hypothetical protein AD947_03195 [Acetobacter tropicalis]